MPKKSLVIVESRGKIDKLEKILGPNYMVLASNGHIMDIPAKKLNVDVENNFKPTYAVSPDKTQTVSKLKAAAAKADKIILAADLDREGEFIAWSIAKVLNVGDDADRITFDNITKETIKNAIANPRKINMDLVNAQQARRVLDRLMGYMLSPLLWKQIQPGLSAGRVQSVVTRLVMDRENQIKEFFDKGADSFYKIHASFLLPTSKKSKKEYELPAVLQVIGGKSSKAEAEEEEVETEGDAEDTELEDEEQGEVTSKKKKNGQKGGGEVSIGTILKGTPAKINAGEENPPKEILDFLKACLKSKFTVQSVFDKKKIKQPGAPYITATLQQEAGMSVARTMKAAQRLYEGGYITYMRTDSVVLSKEAMSKIKEYVTGAYGKEYYNSRVYKNKAKNAQEAHEAIRPTDFDVTDIPDDKLGDDERKIYRKIWQKAVASQMAQAEFKVTNIQTVISKVEKYFFLSQIENLIFDGFLAVYGKEKTGGQNDDDEEGKEPVLTGTDIPVPSPGDVLGMKKIQAAQDFSRPPSRYTEATLVRDMKQKGIGRPATYGQMVTTIQKRNYVVVKDIDGVSKKGYILTITDESDKVIKKKSKTILIGKENKKLVITPIGRIVTEFLIANFSEIMDYDFTSQMEEELDEVSNGNKVWYKVVGHFYKIFAPKVEKMMKDTKSVKLIDKFTKKLGKDPNTGKVIVAGVAKYGPVVKLCDPKDEKKCQYAPIKEPLTLDNITLKDALKLFQYPILLGKYEKKDVWLYKGQYGFYLKHGTNNYAIRAKKAEEGEEEEKVKSSDITLEKAIEIITEARKNVILQLESEKRVYTILKGEYGMFINVKPKGKKIGKGINFKLPDDVKDPKKLTLEEIEKIVDEAYSKKMKFRKFLPKTKNESGGFKNYNNGGWKPSKKKKFAGFKKPS